MNLKTLLTYVLIATPSILSCRSKAQKQAEMASKDLLTLEQIIREKHINTLNQGLGQLAQRIAETPVFTQGFSHQQQAQNTFVTWRDAHESIRNTKRSYYALLDLKGEIEWVDDPHWKMTGRRASVGFSAVRDVLESKTNFARSLGRFGGEDDSALSWVTVSAIQREGKTAGAIMAVWEIHDAAEDLQRQLRTSLLQASAPAQRRVKAREQRKLLFDTPDIWVAFVHDSHIYFADQAPQLLEEAVKSLQLAQKLASKDSIWHGTFEVMNRSWGGAAQRIDPLIPEMSLAVFRFEP